MNLAPASTPAPDKAAGRFATAGLRGGLPPLHLSDCRLAFDTGRRANLNGMARMEELLKLSGAIFATIGPISKFLNLTSDKKTIGDPESIRPGFAYAEEREADRRNLRRAPANQRRGLPNLHNPADRTELEYGLAHTQPIPSSHACQAKIQMNMLVMHYKDCNYVD